MRLFNRTTRSLQPTEQGAIFYKGAQQILETIEEAEAAVADVSKNPRGSLHVAAPLGIGKRLIAPLIPAFKDLYPEIDVRLRLSDRAHRRDRRGRSTSPSCSARSRTRTCASARSPTAGALLCAAPAYLASRRDAARPAPTSSASATTA